MDIGCDQPGLLLTIKIDDNLCWQGDPNQAGKIKIEFDDQDADHCIDIELSGKLPEHTKVNDVGEIQQDLLVEINDICLDDINIDQLVYTLAEYHHDFNGSQSAIVDKFYGKMGCNGRLRLAFSSPVYIWLLENM